MILFPDFFLIENPIVYKKISAAPSAPPSPHRFWTSPHRVISVSTSKAHQVLVADL